MAESELTRGGIWRTRVIPSEIARNLEWFQECGGWEEIDSLLEPFGTQVQSKKDERDCADRVSQHLTGFGPKQSRNLLQGLGVTQYEIPIDSRVIKWLKRLGSSESLPLLSADALGKSDYYCCIMDSLQELCKEAGVLPCIFDASVFASFEKEQNSLDSNFSSKSAVIVNSRRQIKDV